MQNDRLLLLFPDGVGIRNYIYADVFDANAQLILFHNFSPETIAYLKSYQSINQEVVIPDYKESVREKFLRELIALARLHNSVAKTNNETLLMNWVWKQKTWSKKIFYTAVEQLAPYYNTDAKIAALDRKYQKLIRKSAFYQEVVKILKEVAPTAVFCSHQRGVKAAPVFAAAQDIGIPTVTVIYSWDNLPKGRLALHADRYFVWSPHMKAEMAQFFPEVPQEKVVVTGTPQFECYSNPDNIIDKQTFYDTYQLDAGKKIICFSGDDEMTSPDDPQYLNDLAEAIVRAGLQDQYQILMRRSPVDLSGRYDAIISKYSSIIKEAPPLWKNPKASGWVGLYPLYDDVKLLVSTSYYCDIVVNIGSTMAFDFSMFDKPCAFLNYNQPQPKDSNWSVEKVYRFQHFKSMPGQDAVVWIDNKDDMMPKISAAIGKGITVSMKQWRDVVMTDYETASANIKKQLQLKENS